MNWRTIITSTFLLIGLSMFISSCTQDEGFGGNSHIKGQIVEKFYNQDFTVFQFEQAAKDEDVFILFGDDTTVGENTSTSYTGDFKFNYLWPGSYQLFFYSEDPTLATSEKTEMVIDTVLSKNETLDLGTLTIYSTLDWNEGNAKIKGKIMLINYKNESVYPNLVIKDVTPAQEEDVYITYNNDEIFTDRVRTESDGTFVFPNLLKGHYKISVYTEDVKKGGTAKILMAVELDITETNQSITLETITIEKI